MSRSPRLGSEDELVAHVRAARPTALLVSYLPVSDRVLAAARSIRIVSCAAVGVDNVDLAAAEARHVTVCNVPDAATEEVATNAVTMALALVRHIAFLDRHVRQGGWAYDACGLPRRPSTMTLGIVGLGRIGRAVADRGAPFFGRLVGHDPWTGADGHRQVRPMSFEDCLRESDVLTLHLPSSAETDHMIDGRAIGLLPPGAYIVNVSRGRLIETEALLAALDDGRLAGAAVDVADPEPPAPDARIRRHDRMIVTPHSAFYSGEALEAYIVGQAENVLSWARSGMAEHPLSSGGTAGPTGPPRSLVGSRLSRPGGTIRP